MNGAQALASMRFAGKRPVGGVIVTESQEIAGNAKRHGFFALVFDPDKPADWRIVKALDVAVITRLRREAVADTCRAILGAEPRSFDVMYGDGEYEVVHAAR